MQAFHELVSPEEMYYKTGIANMSLNTVYQIHKMKQNGLLKNDDQILMLPDFLGWLLTGEKHTGAAAISTSQMISANTGRFENEILEKLEIQPDLFHGQISSNTLYGETENEMLGVQERIKVISVPGHDTTCAAMAARPDSVFLSSGTWSLIGCVENELTLNKDLMENGYSSYSDGMGRIITVRDIMGMYLLNCCKKEWNYSDPDLGFSEIIEMAEKAKPFQSFIDPDAQIFQDGNQMCGKISGSAKGSKNALLCQFVANATGKECVCGVSEATAAGQLIGLGELKSVDEAVDLIYKSFPVKKFYPQDEKDWQDAYELYKECF